VTGSLAVRPQPGHTPHLLPTFAVVFYIWYLVGTAELVGTSGGVARLGLSCATASS